MKLINKKDLLLIGLAALIIVVVCILVLMFTTDIILGPKEYPGVVSNEYVWANAKNIDHSGMEQFDIYWDDMIITFIDVENINFTRVDNNSNIYRNYGRAYHSTLKVKKHTLDFDYDTNEISLIDGWGNYTTG